MAFGSPSTRNLRTQKSFIPIYLIFLILCLSMELKLISVIPMSFNSVFVSQNSHVNSKFRQPHFSHRNLYMYMYLRTRGLCGQYNQFNTIGAGGALIQTSCFNGFAWKLIQTQTHTQLRMLMLMNIFLITKKNIRNSKTVQESNSKLKFKFKTVYVVFLHENIGRKLRVFL